MNPRDEFSKVAMATFLDYYNHDQMTPELRTAIAREAYLMADAMERKRLHIGEPFPDLKPGDIVDGTRPT